MRLKTKLVLSATALTSAIVLVLSTLFLGELLRQRIEQTASSNDVLVHEVLLMTRQTVEGGLREHPPTRPGESSFDGCGRRAAIAGTADGCDAGDRAVLADGAGCERDGPGAAHSGQHGSGCD